jgi:hypothetical protein
LFFVDLWFVEGDAVWAIPDAAMHDLVAFLEAVDEGACDPATGQEIDRAGASVVADVLGVALDTGAVRVGVEEKEQLALRWAISRYIGAQPVAPEWASQLLR